MIVSEILSQVSSEAVMAGMPSHRNISQMIHRERAASEKFPALPADFDSMLIPDTLKFAPDGSQFLLYDSREDPGKVSDVLIFGTKVGKL